MKTTEAVDFDPLNVVWLFLLVGDLATSAEASYTPSYVKSTQGQFFQSYPRMFYDGNVIATINSSDAIKCQMKCNDMVSCMSMNVKKETNNKVSCQMIDSRIQGKKEKLTPIADVDYSEKDVIPRDCIDALGDRNIHQRSPIEIVLVSGQRVQVKCIRNSDGVALKVQRRHDGSLDFNRDWESYKRGFGDLYGEFWLGLEVLHQITNSGIYDIRIVLNDGANSKIQTYYNVTIGSEADFYRFDYISSDGNAGDSLVVRSKGSAFSTFDSDNDKCPREDSHCGMRYKSGWWFGCCFYGNLNGLYMPGNITPSDLPLGSGMVWDTWRGLRYSLKETKMQLYRNEE